MRHAKRTLRHDIESIDRPKFFEYLSKEATAILLGILILTSLFHAFLTR